MMIFLKEQPLGAVPALIMKIYLDLVEQVCTLLKPNILKKGIYLNLLNKFMQVCGILEPMKKEIFTVWITLWPLWEYYVIPIFKNEQSNGVGISIDPIYETEDTFYLNTQVGESLITNPDPNSVPEEILLYEDPTQGGGYLVLRLSNLVNPGELVMDQIYLDQMRDFLSYS
jgi:hypothetical protein